MEHKKEEMKKMIKEMKVVCDLLYQKMGQMHEEMMDMISKNGGNEEENEDDEKHKDMKNTGNTDNTLKSKISQRSY